MAPRIKTLRKISRQPAVKGFRPFGEAVSDAVTPPVTLLIEEYEAIRLSDFDHCNHQEAAEMMGVSRPTFTRLIDSAHKKISSALVEGKSLIIEGGNIHFDQFLYICEDCGFRFLKSLEEEVTQCPSCGSHSVRNMANHFGHGRGCCGRSRRNRRARRRGNSNRGQGRNN